MPLSVPKDSGQAESRGSGEDDRQKVQLRWRKGRRRQRQWTGALARPDTVAGAGNGRCWRPAVGVLAVRGKNARRPISDVTGPPVLEARQIAHCPLLTV